MSSQPHDRVAFADALRAIAIFSVVANHVAMLGGLQLAGEGDDLAYLGAWGMNCFFVLSGFLLSAPYLRAILGRGPFPSSKMFWARRFYRIYPLYALAVVVSGAVAVRFAPHQLPLASMLGHLSFAHGFLPNDVAGLNAPLWTMAVDAQFYALLPLVSLGLAALAARFTPSGRLRLVGIALGVAFASSLLLRWYVFSRFGLSVVGNDVGTTFVLARNALGMGAAFALGILLQLTVVLELRPGTRVVNGAAALGVALLAVLAWCGRSYVATPTYGICYDALAAVSAALVLYGFSMGAFGVAGRVRRSQLVANTAALAYGVYLFHFLVLQGVADVLRGSGALDGSGTAFAVLAAPTVLVTLAVAYLVHERVEKPFLALRDRHREARGPQRRPRTVRERVRALQAVAGK